MKNILKKLQLLFFFFFLCSLGKAEVNLRSYNSVVLVLEETLIKRLSSQDNIKNYFPDHVVDLDSNREKIALRPYVSRFLREMSVREIKVYVVSEFPEAIVNEILGKFYMLERGVPLKGLVTLLPFSTLTTKPDQLRGTLDPEKTLFAVPSVYEVNSKLNRLSIANTESNSSTLSRSSFLDQSKLGRTFFFLAANMGWHPQLNGDTAKKAINASADDQTAMGIELLAGKFSAEGYDLDIPTFSKDYKCTLTDRLQKIKVKNVDLNSCYDYSNVDFRIAKDDQQFICQMWTREKKPVHITNLKSLSQCFIANGTGFFAKTTLNSTEICGAYLRAPGRYQQISSDNSRDMNLCNEPLRAVTDLHGNSYVYYPASYRENTPENIILETLIKKQFSGNLRFLLTPNQNLTEFKCSFYRSDYSNSAVHISSDLEPCLTESNQVYMLSTINSTDCNAYFKKSELKYFPILKVADERCKSDKNILIDSDKQISIVTKIPPEFKSLAADEILSKIVQIQTNSSFIAKLKYNKGSNNHLCEYFSREDLSLKPYSFENLEGCLNSENNVKFFYRDIQNPKCHAFLKMSNIEYQPITEVSFELCQKEKSISVFDPKRDAFITLRNFEENKNLTEDQLLEKARKSILLRPSSYRSLLKDEKKGRMLISSLGDRCTKAINEITDNGGSLESTILRNALYPLGKVRFRSGDQDNTFYHYTNKSSLPDSFKLRDKSVDHTKYALENNIYDNILYYLRTNPAKTPIFWYTLFYVAEDSASSSSFGDMKLEFILDTETSNTISYDPSLWKKAVIEVANQYPKIKEYCETDFNRDRTDKSLYGDAKYTDIFYIIAEDSGVHVINYDHRTRWWSIPDRCFTLYTGDILYTFCHPKGSSTGSTLVPVSSK